MVEATETAPTRDIGGTTAARDVGHDDADISPGRHVVVPLEIGVTHASLEEAAYALIVGSYEGETMTGAERFLDRQLNGVLGASYEAGSYPGPLGESSLFILPNPDVEQRSSPPGAYVVGLGASSELDRSGVRHSVARALLDRCLQLEHVVPDGDDPATREVGVSSVLLGVRDGEGLSVAESVAGIVEGILDANRALVRYEDARARAGNPVASPVRVVELELIERFGDRADLAAMVVRALPDTIRSAAEELAPVDDLVVRTRRGGLPAGASLVDSPTDWRRFSILSATPTDPLAAADPATLTFDVSFQGGDARADRCAHQLDRIAVDALADRLSSHTGDATSASTLYDLLVPEALRHRFQAASSVQLTVDETTANYPWELLCTPRAAPRVSASARGSVVRQFAESSTRRLVVQRARRGTALIIGAGRVPDLPPLPGALREAELARELLSERLGRDAVEHHDDRVEPMATVDLINALDGDHQILHIASHGEYVESNPALTGALLNPEFRLRVETVRQLRNVPDLVVLNCCFLGKVGTARLAAGLAREFMGMGVRAVIACGWPVGDVAAEAFATAFYTQFLGGTSFADSVASARLACQRVGGHETWAAYQCYGDPVLVFGGDAGQPAVRDSDPVSVADLLRRLESLEIKASDLGRPGSGGLDARRRQLWRSLERYAAWAERVGLVPPTSDDDEHQRAAVAVQRRLARVGAELGELRWAAERYLSLVADDPDETPALPRRWSSAEDLQQASNCLSRAAQHEARRAADGDGDGDGDDGARHRADLERAVSLARAALRITDERESYGILGGALKRLATVAPDHRTQLVCEAASAYESRPGEVDGDVTYTRHTAIQLAAIVDPSVTELPADDTTTRPERARIDARASGHARYWDVVAAGDRLLTRLMVRDGGEPAAVAEQMVRCYERAFASRSTWRQRDSSLDHLRDLTELLPEADDRRAPLARALAALHRWQVDHIGV